MPEINTHRVEDGDSIDLPNDLTDEGVTIHGDHDAFIVVVEDPNATMQTYVRRRDVITADPNPPKATNVVVVALDEDTFDYLEPQ